MATPNKTSWGTTKPPLGAQINRAHPLIKDISYLQLFTQFPGTLIDVTFNQVTRDMILGIPVYLRGAASLSLTQLHGWGLYMGTTTDSISIADSGGARVTDIINGSSCTVFFIRRKLDATFSGSPLWTAIGSTTRAYVPFSDGIVYWDFGGAGAPNRLTWSGYSNTTAPEFWAFTAGLRGSAIYYNGVQVASQTTAISEGPSGELQFAGLPQEFYQIGFLRREWTPAEAAWWYREPYAFMQSVSTPQYFSQIPASGGPWPFHIDNSQAGGMSSLGM